MISVVVANDDALVRAGICGVLRSTRQVEVMGETGNGLRLIELIRRQGPQVVFLDVRMAGVDGVQAIRAIRRQLPSSRVVVYTADSSEASIYRCFRSGASGYLIHGLAPDELLYAVRAVAAGGHVVSSAIAHSVIDKFLQFDRDRVASARARIALLTGREHEVLACVVRGMGNAEIAAQLVVGEGTVKAHVSHMLVKLACTNRVQAALIAHDSGLFTTYYESEPAAASGPAQPAAAAAGLVVAS